MADAAWRWFVALDGGDLDGLLGAAGVMRFDWPSRTLDHRYFDGVSGGHNPSPSPNGKLLVLGNFSQQLLVVDTATLKEVRRQTTMAFEECDYRLRSTTHILWFDDKSFLCAVGDHLYRCDVDNLSKPTKIGPHRLWNVHEMRWSRDRRYVLMGDLGPETSGARQVGLYDLQENRSQVIRLPGTVWHVAVHEEKNLGYAATYSFANEDDDYVQWSPAFTREYLFEFDLATGAITRTWSSNDEFPIHLNSDLELYTVGAERKLYVASGGSHTVVEVDLDDFATTRVVTVTPAWWHRWTHVRQFERNLRGAIQRRNVGTSTDLLMQAYEVSGKRNFDGVYAARVSPDGQYLIAGNRGYNYLRVMDRKSLATVFERQLPTLDGGLHLGMHHSELCAGAGLMPRIGWSHMVVTGRSAAALAATPTLPPFATADGGYFDDEQGMLDELGAAGWELLFIRPVADQLLYYFKRPRS